MRVIAVIKFDVLVAGILEIGPFSALVILSQKKMYYVCLILYCLYQVETYKIEGHGEIKVGDGLSYLVDGNLKNNDNNITSLRYILDYLKYAVVDISSGPSTVDKPPEYKERWISSEVGSAGPVFHGTQDTSYPSGYPKLTAFRFSDLNGETNDKLSFLEFVTLISPVYRMLIGTLNTDFIEMHGKPYPLKMVVHDLLQMAKHFNVDIISNGGETYGMDWSGYRR